jgi:hypothetical protein
MNACNDHLRNGDLSSPHGSRRVVMTTALLLIGGEDEGAPYSTPRVFYRPGTKCL